MNVGDPRGDFLAESMELVRLERAGIREVPWVELREQQRASRAQHGDGLAAPIASVVSAVEHHRGLPALVRMSVDALLDRAPILFELAPIQHADLRAPATRFAELCGSPYLARPGGRRGASARGEPAGE